MVRASVHLSVLDDRPKNRSECVGGARPCPYVSCRYHLFLDIASDGRLFINANAHEDDEDSVVDALRDMPETCALDAADKGAWFDVDVGKLMNLNAQTVRVIEMRAKRKLQAHMVDLPDIELELELKK